MLIAEPGAGKTTAFKAEAESQDGTYVTVRNFRTFDDRPEWRGTTLFLDGLDESRAGAEDGRTPLDDIRKKLSSLEDNLGAGEHGCWLTASYVIAPERYRQDLRALADDDEGLKALAMFMGVVRLPREFTQHFDGDDIVTLVSVLGVALSRVVC